MGILTYSRYISALADTIKENDWSDTIILKCQQLREALDELERIATERKNRGGER